MQQSCSIQYKTNVSASRIVLTREFEYASKTHADPISFLHDKLFRPNVNLTIDKQKKCYRKNTTANVKRNKESRINRINTENTKRLVSISISPILVRQNSSPSPSPPRRHDCESRKNNEHSNVSSFSNDLEINNISEHLNPESHPQHNTTGENALDRADNLITNQNLSCSEISEDRNFISNEINIENDIAISSISREHNDDENNILPKERAFYNNKTQEINTVYDSQILPKNESTFKSGNNGESRQVTRSGSSHPLLHALPTSTSSTTVLPNKFYSALSPLDMLVVVEHWKDRHKNPPLYNHQYNSTGNTNTNTNTHQTHKYSLASISVLCFIITYILENVNLKNIHRYGLSRFLCELDTGNSKQEYHHEKCDFQKLDMTSKQMLERIGRGHDIENLLRNPSDLSKSRTYTWFPNSLKAPLITHQPHGIKKKRQTPRSAGLHRDTKVDSCLLRPTSAPPIILRNRSPNQSKFTHHDKNVNIGEFSSYEQIDVRNDQSYRDSNVRKSYSFSELKRMEVQQQPESSSFINPSTKFGAFEVQIVYCNSNGRIEMDTLHSKLQTKRWPNKSDLITSLEKFLNSVGLLNTGIGPTAQRSDSGLGGGGTPSRLRNENSWISQDDNDCVSINSAENAKKFLGKVSRIDKNNIERTIPSGKITWIDGQIEEYI